MSENKKWVAVYTKPRSEKKVVEVLTRKKIESFYPLNRVIKQWGDRRKIILEPLFPYFVFAKVSEAELTSLKQTDGVANFVYWLGKPAVIRNSEIEAIKQFADEYSNIRLKKIEIKVNDEDLQSDLIKEHNNVIALKNKSVKVELPSLGYLMVAEMETKNAEIMEAPISSRIKLSYFKYAFK
jgi:transcription antitermination factor NusG